MATINTKPLKVRKAQKPTTKKSGQTVHIKKVVEKVNINAISNETSGVNQLTPCDDSGQSTGQNFFCLYLKDTDGYHSLYNGLYSMIMTEEGYEQEKYWDEEKIRTFDKADVYYIPYDQNIIEDTSVYAIAVGCLKLFIQ